MKESLRTTLKATYSTQISGSDVDEKFKDYDLFVHDSYYDLLRETLTIDLDYRNLLNDQLTINRTSNTIISSLRDSIIVVSPNLPHSMVAIKKDQAFKVHRAVMDMINGLRPKLESV